MPSYVIKESPDSDFYVYWSDIVEAPTFGGTRQEIKDYLGTRPDSDFQAVEHRLQRADENGTSAKWPSMDDPYLGWNDKGTIYQQQGTITRVRMFELTRRLLVDESADVSDLLEPFEESS